MISCNGLSSSRFVAMIPLRWILEPLLTNLSCSISLVRGNLFAHIMTGLTFSLSNPHYNDCSHHVDNHSPHPRVQHRNSRRSP